METKFIDLHIHPAMKPMGKSFNRKPGVNNPDKNRLNNIWHHDSATFLDKVLNIVTTLTKFRQSDFTSLAKGGAEVVCVSLCGLEKSFVMSKLGTRLPGDVVSDLVTGLGKKRIDHVQEMSDYFSDLEMEYDFYKQLDGHKVKIDGLWHRYKIVSSFNEIEESQDPDTKTIFIILTIEGAHVFNAGLQMMGKTANPDEVLANVDKVKNWDKKLFFMGLTHHFDNEMVGHAQSLHGVVRKMCDQSDRMNEGFNDLGWKVLRKLLDNSNGKRVLPDLKHMSVKARNEYYRFLEEEYPGEILPLIVSHGAVNGFRSHLEKVEDDLFNYGKFQPDDINFYDDEILRIVRSGGVFGIQFDERRVASETELKKGGPTLNRRKMLFYKSKLIWNQIQHVAEVLNRNDQFAWGIQCIGTDYDGMINPLNGFWGAEEMPLFDSYLEKHAYNFLASSQSDNLKDYNKLKASDIVERFMRGNAWDFLKKNF
ncbi:peptidase M19 [Mariniphaga sediminis]|uniref:Peptidase M19 n=1 Tax=Mariniphaga sediminis TaxID=1628158 RepID=A0A399CVC8_9BACT|nr:membrane dipeptidase [Mariniphaga sediminis]RIH62988.1 peptidase M19 [Mariniphaga sediminis]